MITFLALSLSLLGQCEKPEVHRLFIDGQEISRRYVPAVLPNGYRASIPIINGYLPAITPYDRPDCYLLVLDYRSAIVYNPEAYTYPIQYAANIPPKQVSEKVEENPVPYPIERKKEPPKEPDLLKKPSSIPNAKVRFSI
jgi:hypothetical protein